MRKPMGKWYVFDDYGQQVHGPYFIQKVVELPAFGPDLKLAPQGSTRPGDWRKAKDIPDFQKALADRGLWSSPPVEQWTQSFEDIPESERGDVAAPKPAQGAPAPAPKPPTPAPPPKPGEKKP